MTKDNKPLRPKSYGLTFFFTYTKPLVLVEDRKEIDIKMI